jgi:restriction system protein
MEVKLTSALEDLRYALEKAGLIESTRRGYYKITASGRQVVESKSARVDNNFLSQFEEFEKWRGSDQEVAAEQLSAAPTIVNQKETPDEIMRAAHRQIETALANCSIASAVRRLIFLSALSSICF